MQPDLKHKTCCFTGHRTIPPKVLPALSCELEAVLKDLIQKGIRYFGAGGALGFDTLAAQTVLRMKKQYPQIRLILVLPCREQAKNWQEKDVQCYHSILQTADKVVYTAEHYTTSCMHRRNRHLVDHSCICVAYCTRFTGGSAYTVRYAQQRGVPVIFLHSSP